MLLSYLKKNTFCKCVRNIVFEQVDNFICRDWLHSKKFLLCTAIIESVKPGVKAAVVNQEQFYSLKIKRTWKIWN